MNAKADQKNFVLAYRMVPVEVRHSSSHGMPGLAVVGEGNNVENVIYQSTD